MENIKHINTMEQQFYYTQEGNKYILKCVTAFAQPAFSFVFLGVVNINNKNFTTVNGTGINIKTSKQIIPLTSTISFYNLSLGTIDVNVVSPYFHATILGPPTTIYYKAAKTLAKKIPLIDMVFFTDSSNYGFNERYSQMYFSNDDFLDPTNGLQIGINSNPTLAFAGINENFNISNNGHQYTQTFTYFELQ
jgi:hypothetical protein